MVALGAGRVIPSMEDLGACTNFLDGITTAISKGCIFAGLAEEEITYIASLMHCYRVGANTVLIQEGEPGGCMLLLVEGEVEIRKHDSHGQYRLLTRLGAGEILGEMSLIDGENFSASVITLVPCTIGVLARSALEYLMRTRPEVGTKLLMQFALVMSGRLRRTLDVVTEYMGQ
jgi:CRP/FNR family transcriptional regulator, cyclic AMP receptor protein